MEETIPRKVINSLQNVTLTDDMDRCVEGKCYSLHHGNEIVAVASTRYKEEHIASFINMVCSNCGRVCDNLGRTALHVVSSCGHCLVASWLVRNRSANINLKDAESGYTSLHRAVFYGQIHMAVTLLKLGANAAIKDKEGLTPFDLALKDTKYLKHKPPLDAENDVYVWGTNSNFNLGTGRQRSQAYPEALESFRKQHIKIKQVCMERFHTVFVTNEGKVYSCGHGEGGRLGLGTEQAALIPAQMHFQPYKQHAKASDAKVKCIMASVGQNHTMLLTEDGLVWVCGMNDYYQLGLSPPPAYALSPKSLPVQALKNVENHVLGVCAARYHSVIWGKNTLLTFGANGGQLGHTKFSDPAVITPREVLSLRGEGEVSKVVASDGAIAIALVRTANLETVIYLLHEFRCHKIATRHNAVIQLHVVGGNLDETVITKGQRPCTIERERRQPRLLMLDNRGDLYYWEDGMMTEMSRCTYNLGRAVNINTFAATQNGRLLLSTYDHEAFEADLEVHTSVTKNIKLKLKRIPNTYRTVGVCCDPEGRNFAVLQTTPTASVTAVPKMGPTEMGQEMKSFLEGTKEEYLDHDLIFQIGNARFPAHKFITASKSDYIKKLVQQYPNYDLELQLHGIHPTIFQELLYFMYSNNCAFFMEGQCCERLMNVVDEDVESLDNRETQSRSRKRMRSKRKHSIKIKKNPLQMAFETAKLLEMPSFLNEIEKYRYENGNILRLEGAVPEKLPNFRRLELPELYDVRLCGRDGVQLRAHNCILRARCKYFLIELCCCRAEASSVRKSEKIIHLPISSAVLEAVIDFLYEDVSEKVMASTDIEFVSTIFALAHLLSLKGLQNIAGLALANLVTLHNVGLVLRQSAIHGAHELKLFCMDFITCNMAAVLEARSLIGIGSILLEEISEYYRNNIRAMSYRVITPSSSAPAEDVVQNVEEAFQIKPSVTHEPGNIWEYGLVPQETSRKQGPEKTSGKKSPTDAVGATAIEISDRDELDDLEATFKALSLEIYNLVTQFEEEDSSSHAAASASINVEDLEEFPELKSKSPSSSLPVYSRHLSSPSPPMHSRGKHAKRSRKQRKRLAISGDSENICAVEGADDRVGSPSSFSEIAADQQRQGLSSRWRLGELLNITQLEEKNIKGLHVLCMHNATVGDEGEPDVPKPSSQHKFA